MTVVNSRVLVARHPWIRLRELAGGDHFAVIDPTSQVCPVVLEAISP